MDKPKKKHRTRKKRIDIDTVSKSSSSTATMSTGEAKEKEKTHTTTQDDKSQRPAESQEAPESPRGSGASSPEPNCAICLGRLENRSFTDSCFHTFCFVCLVEWSKVKAECPLCKQSFKSIYHNVRSNDDYDQYPVRRHEEANPLNQMRHLMEGMRFRYRTTVTDHHYASGVAARIDQEIQSRLLQRPSNRLPIPNWRRIRQPANSDFRRSVYLQRLKQRAEHMNTRRRVRETAPSFFRDNPAQTHRLVPWLNRELNALLHGHGEQIAFVLDLIMGLIKRHAINSEEFYQHVFPYIGRHTRQFMEEFMMFAKSPYHMSAYDRHVTYEEGGEPHHDSASDSDNHAPDDDNDSDVVVVSPDSSPETSINPVAAPPRSDTNLDPWERSIMTVGNPSYLGFPPIVRSFGSENLSSLGYGNFFNPRTRLDLPTSASGWDSPTPGPSSIFDNIGLIPTQSLLSESNMVPGSSSCCIYTPSASSYSAPITPTQTHTESADNLLDPLNLQPVASNSQRDPIVCNESDSESVNSDEVMIVDYEKPWEERSPIPLSSACEDTDSDIVITGTSYIESSVKKEKKKKKKHNKKDNREKDQEISRKRTAKDSSDILPPKKRRHSERSRSRSIHSSQGRSRSKSVSPLHIRINHPVLGSSISQSRSRSPIRMRLYKPADYSHKKFGYRTESRDRKRDRHHSHRSHSSTSSRHSHRQRWSSGTLTDSGPDSDTRHVSYTSHKHRNASIEILEYHKKSSKHKKNKKHTKDKKKGEKKSYHDSNKSKDQTETLDLDLIGHKKKHAKSKKKKSKHKTHKDRPQRESESERNIDSELMNNAESNERSFPQDVSRHVARMFKEIAEIKQQTGQETIAFTSDSDADSEIENEGENEPSSDDNTKSENSKPKNKNEQVRNERPSDLPNQKSLDISENAKAVSNLSESQLNPEVFAASEIEFVELPLDQTASVDLELASIAKSLENSTASVVENFSGQKLFKKHPFGHKKSGKHTVDSLPVTENHGYGQQVSSVPISTLYGSYYTSQQKQELSEDHIQSSDISSCTDIGNTVNSETGNNNQQKNSTSDNVHGQNIQDDEYGRQHENRSGCKNETIYESPTSSAIVSPVKDHSHATDFLDVETLSGESDVDVVGESYTPLAIPSYKTSASSIKLTNINKNATDTSKPEQVNSYKDEIDVTGVSDSESVVEFVGEEQRKITIGSDCSDDSADNSYIEVLQNDSDNFVDVIGHSDEDTLGSESDYIDVTDNQRSNQINIQSDSNDTELDYSGDFDDNISQNDFKSNLSKQKYSKNSDESVLEFNDTKSISDSDELTLSLKRVQQPCSSDCVSVFSKNKQITPLSADVQESSKSKDDMSDKVDNVEKNFAIDNENDKSTIDQFSSTPQNVETVDSSNEECDSATNCPKKSCQKSESENEKSHKDIDTNSESPTQTKDLLTPQKETDKDSTANLSSSHSESSSEAAQLRTSLTFGSSDLAWTNNSVVQPREPDFFSDTGYTGMEPGSPLFQLSPECDQLYTQSPSFNEFSPAASDTSDDNFVPED